MPQLVRFYIRHVLIGFAIAAVFVAGLVALDVMGLRHLLLHTDGGTLALVMLVFGNGVVFAGVQFAIAVMGLAEPRPPSGGRGARLGWLPRRNLRPVRPQAAPIPVADAGGEPTR